MDHTHDLKSPATRHAIRAYTMRHAMDCASEGPPHPGPWARQDALGGLYWFLNKSCG
jgi:hypothetical protein